MVGPIKTTCFRERDTHFLCKISKKKVAKGKSISRILSVSPRLFKHKIHFHQSQIKSGADQEDGHLSNAAYPEVPPALASKNVYPLRGIPRSECRRRDGSPRFLPYLALLRMGFVRPGCYHGFTEETIPKRDPAGGLLPRHFTLIPTSRDGIVSATLSVQCILRCTSPGFSPGILPCGVRTFLPAPEFRCEATV